MLSSTNRVQVFGRDRAIFGLGYGPKMFLGSTHIDTYNFCFLCVAHLCTGRWLKDLTLDYNHLRLAKVLNY